MVIIARGDNVRHFTVRPWMAALLGSAFAAVAVGYLLATTYLVFRDDLIGASLARQARIQHAYEDRISMLRAQVDRIASRQLLDQESMENKVRELLTRQAELSERHGIMGALLQRTDKPRFPESAPLPVPRPDRPAGTRGAAPELRAYAASGPDLASVSRLLRGTQPAAPTLDAAAEKTFFDIDRSLSWIEIEQIEKIRTLAESAYQTAEEISSAFAAAGLEIDIEPGIPGTGGPLIAPDAVRFESEIGHLDEALRTLDEVKAIARRLPLYNPAPDARITSGFGVRRDPILGSRAHHSGMDFRVPRGHPIRAAGGGTVVAAGWNGGYGRMIEIDHGNGIMTRYAHLNRIAVKIGDRVAAGRTIGQAGSSGRSTGPHLHYEVRHGGVPTNPLKFLAAGKKILKYL